MARSRALRPAVAAATITAVVSATGSAAEPPRREPARSGTIYGGYFPGLAYLGPSPSGCFGHAECTAWLASGCDPRLAGRDPAVHDSIVDMHGLRDDDSRHWTITVSPRDVTGAGVHLLWGGVTVEFWTAECVRIDGVGGRMDDRITERRTFWMPPATAWMTVASSDNTTLSWSLFEATRDEVRRAWGE